jgi:hypothetical protein
LLERLVDEALAYFIDWRRDAASVSRTYRDWSDAPADEKSGRFAACMAALDQEEASAAKYAEVIGKVLGALDRAA